jgi:glycosyltransferase involved in cell wall biosynthesis
VPKVSVIITCYNSEKYIRQALDSILAQDYDSFQVYAVNDGSSDATASILQTYGNRITVLSHPDGSNHGQSASLNLGISLSDSDYIAFMDHDDLWQPDKLKKQVAILDQRQDVGLVYTNGYVVDAKGDRRYTLLGKEHVEKNSIGDILLDCYIRTPSMVMVRRSLLTQVGSFVQGIIADQDMWVRIKEVSRFHYLDELLVYYREHQGQTSVTNNIKMWKDALWVLENAMRRYPYPAWIRSKRLAVIHYRLGKASQRMQAYPTAIMHLVKSLRYDPSRAVRHVTGKKVH